MTSKFKYIISWSQKQIGPKMFLDPTKFCGTLKFSWTKFFWNQNSFKPPILLDNNFYGHNGFWTQHFLGKFFWDPFLFYTTFLDPISLAAMSSPRSDIVTLFVCLFVFSCVPFIFLLLPLEYYLVLKCFNCVSRDFKRCLMFQGCFQ